MKKKSSFKKALIAIAIILVVLIIGVVALKYLQNTSNLNTYWTKESAVAKDLREYVAKVTNPKIKTKYLQSECFKALRTESNSLYKEMNKATPVRVMIIKK